MSYSEKDMAEEKTEENGTEHAKKSPSPHEKFLLDHYRKIADQLVSGQLSPEDFSIQMTKTQVELENKADKDGLTGFFNNVGFSGQLTGEMELTKRLRQPSCLLAIDVDHLGNFNNTLGHVAGDQLIQLYSNVIEVNSRQHDLKGRVGGDEFCVFLLGADPVEAKKVADRMRENIIDAVKRQFPELSWKQTMSIGIAKLNEDDTVPTLRDKADKAMYQAKIPRNTTVIYGETAIEPTSEHK